MELEGKEEREGGREGGTARNGVWKFSTRGGVSINQKRDHRPVFPRENALLLSENHAQEINYAKASSWGTILVRLDYQKHINDRRKTRGDHANKNTKPQAHNPTRSFCPFSLVGNAHDPHARARTHAASAYA